MIISPEVVTTKKNKSITFRSSSVEDAQAIKDAMVEIAETSPYILSSAEDFRAKSLQEEQQWVQRYTENPRGMIIIAEYMGKIVGITDFSSGKLTKTRHRGSLGISLHSDVRGEGLGGLLMTKLIKEVRSVEGILQMELSALSLNAVAIQLYKNVGFRETGRRTKAYRQPDGSFCDEVIMILEL